MMNTILFAAQDMNMTNGDYAFFTYSQIPLASARKPWTQYPNMTQSQLNRRKEISYVVKQVGGTINSPAVLHPTFYRSQQLKTTA
jgi:hypothetical protein